MTLYLVVSSKLVTELANSLTLAKNDKVISVSAEKEVSFLIRGNSFVKFQLGKTWPIQFGFQVAEPERQLSPTRYQIGVFRYLLHTGR